MANSINIDEVIKAGSQMPQPVRGEYMTIAEQLEARGKARGKAEGKAEGEAKGKAEEKVAIAINMFALGLSNEIIAQSTGLAIEKVIELRNQHDKQ